jgi:hypothetical protein
MSQPATKQGVVGYRRKLREAALITPLLGLFLLLPPFISVFSIDVSVFGIPLIVLYIFAVWIFLILAARFLSRRLMPEETTASGSSVGEVVTNAEDAGRNGADGNGF